MATTSYCSSGNFIHGLAVASTSKIINHPNTPNVSQKLVLGAFFFFFFQNEYDIPVFLVFQILVRLKHKVTIPDKGLDIWHSKGIFSYLPRRRMETWLLPPPSPRAADRPVCNG